MNIKSFVAIVVGLIIFAGSNNASAQSGLSDFALITSVNPSGSGVRITGPVGNPAGCTDDTFFFLPRSNDAFTEFYAAMLTALAAGQEVRFFLVDCIQSGSRLVPEIRGIELR